MDKKAAQASTQETVVSSSSRPKRNRVQTSFYFEEAIKELEDYQQSPKKQKLDAYSDDSDISVSQMDINKPEKKQNKFDGLVDSDLVFKSSESGAKKDKTRIILWLRNDLRLHDNYIMNWAMQAKNANKEIIPVYCFDPRYYDKEKSQTKYGTRKTGIIRSKFQLESVQELRTELEAIKSKLLISTGKPEDFISKLLDPTKHNIIVYQQEITPDELKVEDALLKNLKNIEASKKISVQINSVWGLTLHHIKDLDYNPKEYLPHVYGKFRERGAYVKVRPLLPTPTKGQLPFAQKLSKLEEEAAKYLPNLSDFGFTKEEIATKADSRACYKFIGGESNGLKRMNEYIFEKKSVGHYNETRNHLLGSEYSSKLSPWLANGTLSARQVYFATHQFMKVHRSNESTRVFIDELFWRDFNKYWFMRFGQKAFSEYGIYDRSYYNWNTDKSIVERWQKGETGMPLIDSLMREMNHTGFMPNRGRMVVACYLVQDLRQDWRYGAHYFEEKLIDHDVSSNYGGWNFSGGIGPGRVLVFNSLKQSKDFDANGKYIKKWCPELKGIDTDYIHDPWNMPASLQKTSGVRIGDDYPKVIQCTKYTNAEVAKKQKRSNAQLAKLANAEEAKNPKTPVEKKLKGPKLAKLADQKKLSDFLRY